MSMINLFAKNITEYTSGGVDYYVAEFSYNVLIYEARQQVEPMIVQPYASWFKDVKFVPLKDLPFEHYLYGTPTICEECDGAGVANDGMKIECPECEGMGEVEVDGSTNHHDYSFECECKTCDGDGKIFTKGNTKGGKCKCCMGTKFDLVLLQQPAARDYVETSYDIIDVIKYLLHKGGAEIGFIQKYALIRWQNVSFIISDYFIEDNF